MSEQHAPQPPPDPGAAMVEAYVSGDKQAAQRLLDARNAQDGVGQGAGENNAPVAFPESAPTEQSDFLAEQMRSQPDGERWIAELGGEGSPDFAQNVSLAMAGYQRLAQDAPHIIEAFNGIITREDGTEFSPGDDPSLIYHLAKYERLLRAGGGDALPAPFQATRNAKLDGNKPQQRTTTPAPRAPSASTEDRLDDLTSQIHAARNRGDNLRAARLDAERSRLFAATYGDEAIVGREGRYG